MATMASEPQLDERARRVRNLLSSYYGPTDEDGSDGSGREGGIGSPARFANASANINRKGFDSDRYLSTLLREARLEGLLGRHLEMAAEIRTLDSDMQMLVYENYNKFISATDTIRRMKENVGGMESSMRLLLDTVTVVRSKSDDVNSSLSERRERIEKLNGTRSLLRKVQYVFDLPKRLQSCVDREDYAEAVRCYVGAGPILRKYGDTSFLQCKEESDLLMEDLTNRLHDRVVSEAAPSEERREAVELLSQLNYPIHNLQDGFLEDHWEWLMDDLKTTVSMAAMTEQKKVSLGTDGVGGGGGEEQGSGGDGHGDKDRRKDGDGTPVVEEKQQPEQQSQVGKIEGGQFVSKFAAMVDKFRTIFPMGEQRLMIMAGKVFDIYFDHVRSSFLTKQRPSRSSSDGKGSAGASAASAVDPYIPDCPSLTARSLVAALKMASKDVMLMHEKVPEAKLRDRCAQAVCDGVLQHVEESFKYLERRVNATIFEATMSGSPALSPVSSKSQSDGGGAALAVMKAEIGESGGERGGGGGGGGSPLLKSLRTVEKTLLEGSLEVLKDLSLVVEEGGDLMDTWRDEYIDRVQGHFQSLFASLNDSFLGLCAAAGGAQPCVDLAIPTSDLGSRNGSRSSDVSVDRASAGEGGQGESMAAEDKVHSLSSTAAGVVSSGSKEGGGKLSAAGNTPTWQLLLLARVCVFIQESAVPNITEVLALSFSGGGAMGGEERPAFVPAEVIRVFRSTGEKLLQQYVDAQARKLTLMVKKSIATPNWLKAKEPRDVRMIADLLLQELEGVEGEVAQLLERGDKSEDTWHMSTSSSSNPPNHQHSMSMLQLPSGSHRRTHSMPLQLQHQQVQQQVSASRVGSPLLTSSRGGGGGGGGEQIGIPSLQHTRSRLLERDVARLFKERVQLFTKVQFTQLSVMESLIKVCIKSFAECVRLETFSRSGHQQIQLDTYYLRPHLRALVGEEQGPVVDMLLDEVCTAAGERCLDPTPLEPAVMDRIIQTKKSRYVAQSPAIAGLAS